MKYCIDNNNPKIQDVGARKSVVIYARESNHTGAEESLEKQKERLKEFCEQKGYLVANEVATIGNRQESLSALKQAIECAKNAEGKTLLMASSNRVVGTYKEVAEIAELIAESGITITTMDGSYENILKCGTSPSLLIEKTLSTSDDE